MKNIGILINNENKSLLNIASDLQDTFNVHLFCDSKFSISKDILKYKMPTFHFSEISFFSGGLIFANPIIASSTFSMQNINMFIWLPYIDKTMNDILVLLHDEFKSKTKIIIAENAIKDTVPNIDQEAHSVVSNYIYRTLMRREDKCVSGDKTMSSAIEELYE